MSSPQPSHISKREVSSRPSATLSERAQPDTGPSGVEAQSWARMRRAISLSPTKTSSCALCGAVETELIGPLVAGRRDIRIPLHCGDAHPLGSTGATGNRHAHFGHVLAPRRGHSASSRPERQSGPRSSRQEGETRSNPRPAPALAFRIPSPATMKASAPTQSDRHAVSDADLDIAALIERAQRHAFDYFETTTDPVSGLVLDSTQPDSPCSITGVGMALTAYPIAVERGWMTRLQGLAITLKTLRFLADADM